MELIWISLLVLFDTTRSFSLTSLSLCCELLLAVRLNSECRFFSGEEDWWPLGGAGAGFGATRSPGKEGGSITSCVEVVVRRNVNSGTMLSCSDPGFESGSGATAAFRWAGVDDDACMVEIFLNSSFSVIL